MKTGRPVKVEVLLRGFDLKGQRMRSLLVDRLDEMLRAGQIIENRRGEYCLTEKLELVAGRVSGHREGFGFVIPDDGSDDILPVGTGDAIGHSTAIASPSRSSASTAAGNRKAKWPRFWNAESVKWRGSSFANAASGS